MADDPRLIVEAALAQAVATVGQSFMDDPRQTCAIVADVVGNPSVNCSAEILLLRSSLNAAMRLGDEGPSAPAAIHAVLRADGVTANESDWAVSLLERHGVVDSPRRSTRQGRSWWLGAAMGLAIIVVLIWLIAISDEETSFDSVAPTTTERNGGSSTLAPTTTDPQPLQRELVARFPPVREGEFVVERAWKIEEEGIEFVGIALLTPFSDVVIAGSHRELAPPAIAPTELVWTPQTPDVSFLGLSARFANINLDGDETIEIRYRFPLPSNRVYDESDLLAWYDDWVPQALAVRGPFTEGYDDLLPPLLE